MSYKDNISEISNFYQQREKAPFDPNQSFHYIVPMFPYPSGKIHMGHIRNYSISNVVAQYQKFKGNNVFHPIGFDSFGMPAENAAIKNKVSPAQWTESNIEQMTKDFKDAGFDFDWENTIQTHKFEYYKFEQEIFRKAWEAGIIYKKEKYVNYDPEDKTVLSNEQVINGFGWRTGAKVVKKKIPMFFFDMKRYAKRLHDGLSECNQWPKKVIEMQKHWIGYEEGIDHIVTFMNKPSFTVFKSHKEKEAEITSIIVGINNEWVHSFKDNQRFISWEIENSEGGVSQKDNFSKKIQFETEVFVNFKDKKVPVYIDMNSDEEIYFSSQGIIESCVSNTSNASSENVGNIIEIKPGVMIKLKDWCISRQRYWGNPIPVISCDDCGDVVSEENVKLPTDMIPDGVGNVLNHNESFVNCDCPKCGKPAKRCTDTMDTFVQSSWYFHRYVSPKSNEMIEFPNTQIDHYIGGVEHATMHLIYTRFFHKMMADFGMVSTQEPIKKLTTQGMVCKKYTNDEGVVVSSKMSKSIGNIVEPQEYIEKYGSDALQMFMIFAAPPDQNFDFEDDGIVGSFRFLNEVYQYFFEENKATKTYSESECVSVIDKSQKNIEKEFDGRFNLNTTVPQMMIAFKTMKKTEFVSNELKEKVEKQFIKMLSIVAPQIGYYIQEKVLNPEMQKISKFKV